VVVVVVVVEKAGSFANEGALIILTIGLDCGAGLNVGGCWALPCLNILLGPPPPSPLLWIQLS